ncbi:MAG: ArnT family glycosyltransferase [Acidimicrobiales bacterium]
MIDRGNDRDPSELDAGDRLGPATVPESVADSSLTRLPRRPVFAAAAAVFALEMALSGLYGFHRDELYFLDCARHLQGGYVDQPILTPLLARVSLELFGVSLPGIRFWSALAAAATVIIGAMLARELGGGRLAQIIAAIGVATMPVLLGADHLLDTTPFDILAWAGLAWVVVRIGRTENPR